VTERRRVVIVVPGFPTARDETALAAIVDLVERVATVHDTHVVALRHPPAGPRYRLAGATIHAAGAGGAHGVRGRATVLRRGVRLVRALDRDARVDVIHGLWLDEPGAVAVLAGRFLRRPTLASLMGGELTALPDIAYGAALGRGGRWTTTLTLALADLVSAPSIAGVVALEARRGGRPVVGLPLGVDPAVFAPGPGKRPVPADRGRTVLFVGGLEPVKDPARLLRVTARLMADRPEVRLEVIGEGRLRPALETLAAELGITDRVAFRGPLPRTALPDRYRAATVLAVPSRHEAQSMVAVEAAASALPVVGTRVGILPDLGDGARTIGPGAADDAFAEALAAVLDDPALASSMGTAGRAAVLRQFALDRTAAATLDAYERLIDR
jgi:glycosyltransferase involved in cell wall biosynthesis